MKLLVTGGAGFIGSNFIKYWLKKYPKDYIVNLDKLTYAGHLSSTKDFATHPNYNFVQGDICDVGLVNKIIADVDLIVHFAAESHVDRSILDPLLSIKTNVLGTSTLLEAALQNKVKRFHHVSTDEVFGELDFNEPPFTESSPLKPRSPYSAAKAGSDLLAKAYFETYHLPVTISNCANNYGPFHDPEKLIPRFITNLLEGQKVPLMGKGENIRPWLFVEDHCRAIDIILNKSQVGQTYCIEGEEKRNIEVTRMILKELGIGEEMIEYVEHRLGHDKRYALDSTKLKKLGWVPSVTFEEGLKKTINWYKENSWWWKPLKKEFRPVVDRVAQRSYQI